MNIELGISSFGETTPLEETGKAISHDQRIRDLLEEIILADKLNIDAFAHILTPEFYQAMLDIDATIS